VPQDGNSMAKVTIYTTMMCPFCHHAKRLLTAKGVGFEEVDVTFSPAKRREMTDLAGSRSVPQVFVDGRHVGDCDRLHSLDAAGRLDPILAGTA